MRFWIDIALFTIETIRMNNLIIYRNEQAILRYPLDQNKTVIGRSFECDIPLEDLSISRKHCSIVYLEGGYNVIDHSINGIYSNGERIVNSLILSFGQKVEFGEYSFALYEENDSAKTTTINQNFHPTQIANYSQSTNEITVAKLTLQIRRAGATISQHTFDSFPISIGSAISNSITIDDDQYLSRNHCKIEITDDGTLLLNDLASCNGTYFESKKVSRQIIPDEGEIKIGETIVKYRRANQKEKIEASKLERLGDMLGVSRHMREVFALITRVAPSNANILVTAETGCGKELVARALHKNSGRSAFSMVALNCGALPANIIESELFGHERGAFTGANNLHKGAFEQASGGTLFLDEIGEMPLDLQTRLLRVLETRTVRRVGGNQDIPVNCRIVAATNRDLATQVAEKEFREDLYYRLYIIPIVIVPLRERPDDTRMLINHFLNTFTAPGRKLELHPLALRKLLEHSWPGNIRELRNTIERTVITVQENIIKFEDIKFVPTANSIKEKIDLTASDKPNALDIRERERQLVLSVLHETGGNISHASRHLGVSRSTLQRKAKLWGIDLDEMRVSG